MKMKNILNSRITHLAALPLLLAALTASGWAQTASWNGGGGDGDWNTALNWDIGVPAEGTNAVIGVGNTVNYTLPMAATGFGALTDSGVLNVSAAGFNATASSAISGGAARFYVNSGGAAAVTTGNLTFTTGAGGAVAAGGSLSVAGLLNVGSSGAGNTGFMTNNGGFLSAATTRINPNNLSSTCRLIINGGTNNLGNVSIWRSSSSSYEALGTEGLVIKDGLVRMTSLSVGSASANSHLTMWVSGGIVTNTGTFIVEQVSSTRGSRFLQTGGLFVSTDPSGARVGVMNAGQVDIFSVTGGTNIAEKFTLGDITNNSGTVNFTNGATIVVGSGGIISNTINTLNVALNNGGKFCAKADWASQVKLMLTGGSFTFNTADLDGTPHNITLNGALVGGGALMKTGGGTLTLNASGNSYNGATTVIEGSLAIGPTGASSSPTINISAGAVYDISAAGTATNLSSSQALGGSGAVNGSLTALSGSFLRPGGLLTAGTLTLSNNLTEVGGGSVAFDLSDDPTGTIKTNDFLNVMGDLNLGGTNIISINALSGPLPAGSTYTLLRYGGNLTGGVGNLALAGVAGSLSLDAGAKTISLVIAGATRAPTNVVWLGGLAGNNWDTVTTSNWLNGASRDIFVTGDSVRFDDAGATNPVANLVGSVSPASLVVDTGSNYVFSGSGAIDGIGGLTKTNTGTLTILSVNGYLGVTTIGGGIIDVSALANGNLPSSIGGATTDPTNLVFFGGTLRYLGASTSTDRGATLNEPGATIEVTNSATTLTMNGTLAGSGPLIKTGPGTLTLTGANSYTNGTVISNGVLRVNTATSAGSGGITNYGSTFRIATSTTLGNMVDWRGTCLLDLNNNGGNQAIDGAWSGDGTVNFINQQSSTIRTFTIGGASGGNLANFTGTINIGTNNGVFRFNDGGGSPNLGNSSLFLDLGTSTPIFLARNRGVTIQLGALAGGSGTVLTNGTDGSGTTTFVIGGRNVDSTMAGSIGSVSGAPIAITKVGTGTLTLAGLNPYYGATTISEGVLALSGSGTLRNTPNINIWAGAALDASTRTDGTLTLNSGQIFLGEGQVRGSVNVKSNATVSPGPSAGVISKLTITNALTIQPGGILVMEADHWSGTNDVIDGLASITYGGILNLTLYSVDVTSSFKLFDAGSYGGAFAMITPASPGVGLVWDTSSLAVDGTLKVRTFSGAQPNITAVTAAGSGLTLSGSGGPAYLTYTVSASSDLSLPAASWTPVGTGTFKSDGSFVFNTSIDTNGVPQFYAVQFISP